MKSLHPFVCYTSTEGLKWTDLDKVINNFSNMDREKVLSLKNEKDRISTVLGRLLLFYMVNRFDSTSNLSFTNIGYTKNGRPYVENKKIDFNISHSHEVVACVMCKNNIVGIDVEVINEVNLSEYLPVLTKNEFHYLQNHAQQKEEFTKLWTIKESVLKADGRGFLANIEKLLVMGNISKLDSQIWYNYSYKIKNNYYLSVASKYVVHPIISEIDIFKLISLQYGK